jgi:hypothetical protein
MQVGGLVGKAPVHPEGSGFSHGKTTEMGDRFITAKMLFPGNPTAAYVLVQPNEQARKAMMKNPDTGDYAQLSDEQKLAHIRYDAQPDVLARRWETMSPMAKMCNIEQMPWGYTFTSYAKFAWYLGLGMITIRLFTTSNRTALKWAAAYGAVGYGMFLQPALK